MYGLSILENTDDETLECGTITPVQRCILYSYVLCDEDASTVADDIDGVSGRLY